MSYPTNATRPTAAHGTTRAKTGWPVIAGLVLLSVLPVIGGALRLGEVSADPGSAPSGVAAVAIVTHIVAMTVFCLLGAFQFSPALRTRRRWHRTAGRTLIPSGFLAAASAIWLAVFFGGPPDEFATAMVRLVFAAAMAVILVEAVIAIRRRDFTAHGAWMTRAYALAVTGGTQAVVSIVWSIPFGEPAAAGETWVVAAGFVINAVVAEVLIRRRAARRMPCVPAHATP